MSYLCGVGPGMAKIGIAPRDPGMRCDLCGFTLTIRGWIAPRWLLDGKLPRGWRKADGGKDACPKCVKSVGGKL